MDILYLTLSDPELHTTGIYSDLVHELTAKGHRVTIAFADSPKNTKKTVLTEECGVRLLKVRVGELFKVNFIKKGINTLKVEPYLKHAICKYLGKEHFDLVLYATPPVTFASVVKYCQKAYHCRSFLMLKDIFPQNAVDIGLFSENGLLHRFFKRKEKQLYAVSDVIGCMSQGNLNYVQKHNPEISKEKLIIFPNTMKVEPLKPRSKANETSVTTDSDKVRFVFGGNLGKPQAIGFLLHAICSERMHSIKKAEFLFVGSGSEEDKVKEALEGSQNAKFIDFLPPEKYRRLMESCDVGIISLDVRFTIPNYPSRTLGYMATAKPMIACTDRNTDIRALLLEEADCGLWCASDDVDVFCTNVELLCEDAALRKRLGENGRKYLEEHFTVEHSVALIEKYIETVL